MTNSANGRIEALKQREREIREKIAEEKVRATHRKAKNEAKLFAIVGRALVKFAAETPDFHLMLKQILQGAALSDSERVFLKANGWQ
jgi:hypothetical protein